ncbi:MAG: cytochrome P450 [Novosphingobium sp.]|nr:cytochrome P450 [Novosphingobium sp.]
MQPLVERDYFTDYEILKDPYAFFEALREHGPIYQPPGRDYVVVTGFEETLEVLRNHDAFSAIIGLQGAAAPLPFTPHGHDITDQVEAHRQEFIGGNFVVNLDDTPHTNMRALINTLFTPSRLKANESYIRELSDQMVREAVANGGVEMIGTIATPFVTLVIADLLGVPQEDRRLFMDTIAKAPPPGNLDGQNEIAGENHPFVIMGSYFAGYIHDRRANPRGDILSELANATYPDGTKPELQDVVELGMFMFGAGQDTSAKLLGNAMKFIVTQPGLQDQLRADPKLIPAFLEEVLRIEGSTKQTARLARKDTRIGDVAIPAGTKVLVALSAANRDPARWSNPNELEIDRPKIKEHVAFGRGKHVCAGAPLARVEVRVILEKFFEHTARIALDASKHPNGVADLLYEPSFIIRGLAEMSLELSPAPGFSGRSDAPSAIPRAAAPVASGAVLSTRETKLGELLDDSAGRAVLDKHFPGMASDPQVAMAKGMTLRAMQAFAPAQFTDAALDAIDAELARLASAAVH